MQEPRPVVVREPALTLVLAAEREGEVHHCLSNLLWVEGQGRLRARSTALPCRFGGRPRGQAPIPLHGRRGRTFTALEEFFPGNCKLPGRERVSGRQEKGRKAGFFRVLARMSCRKP